MSSPCPAAAPVLGPPRLAPQPGDWASTLPVGLEDPGLPRDPLWPQPTWGPQAEAARLCLPSVRCPVRVTLSLLQPDLVCWLAGCRSQESRPLSLCELEGAASLLWGVISGSGPRWRRGLGRLGWAEDPDPPSSCPQRSFTLIVEAWDWDNDTTPDGESAPEGPRGAAYRASLLTGTRVARLLVLCLLGQKAHSGQGAASALQVSAPLALAARTLCCARDLLVLPWLRLCSGGGPASSSRSRTWAVPGVLVTSC